MIETLCQIPLTVDAPTEYETCIAKQHEADRVINKCKTSLNQVN